MEEKTVKVVRGVLTDLCLCGNWLMHWEKYSRQQAYFCAARGCANIASKGVHVQKNSGTEIYVIPLCSRHSIRTVPFAINESMKLIAASVCRSSHMI